MRIDLDRLDDPRLDDYRGLRERDTARLRGAFVAEGAEVIARLVASPWSVRSVAVARTRLPRIAPALQRLDPSVPVFVLSLDRMRELVGFDVHRGLLAAGERGSGPSLQAVWSDPDPLALIGLLGLSNTDNVGACFRHAAAFGAAGVILDRRCADPLYRRALRVSMGHALRVPWEVMGTADELLARLRQEGVASVALTPDPGAIDLGRCLDRSIAPPERFALLVGTEGSGLDSEVLARADLRIGIPMAEGADSLNAATATAIALFALRHAAPRSFRT